MIKKLLGSFLIVFFSIVIFLFFKTGAYKSVETEITDAPKLKLYYLEHIGPYHKILDKINVVEETLLKLQTPCKKTFGLFLSDPKIVEHEKLISHVGCAFYDGEAPEFFTPPEGLEEKLFGLDLTGKRCYKGSFDASPSLSAIKIYPRLHKMAEQDRVKLRLDALEIYHIDGDNVKTEVYLCED